MIEVVAALNQPQYPAAVATAARVIAEHLAGDESIAAPKREAYVTFGAIPALVAACTTHLNHAGVAEAVCRALSNLIQGNSINQVQGNVACNAYLYICVLTHLRCCL